MSETVGWRHFRVTQLQKKGKSMAFVLMQASCDPRAQLWVSCPSQHWVWLPSKGVLLAPVKHAFTQHTRLG